MGGIPAITNPAPRALIGIAGGQLLNYIPALFNHEDLLTAIAAKGFCQGDWY